MARLRARLSAVRRSRRNQCRTDPGSVIVAKAERCGIRGRNGR
ncbi:unnamed protein product [Chondrus crispus]|uniref:Uncharacterized protein n=1 Tax=Chondrus crispus TaxID=2769 RepID=R7QI78_CHOCR|nr:unnamed protein product [Chondrus crispus]CDF38222.1 unnamed protein product [Chondrus crispus]|eukprot:XP_005718108.1 unnamed protein product [Chondrus crispus]